MFAVLRSTIRTASLGSDTVPCRPIASFGSSLPSLSATPHGVVTYGKIRKGGNPLVRIRGRAASAMMIPAPTSGGRGPRSARRSEQMVFLRTKLTNSWLDRSARLR